MQPTISIDLTLRFWQSRAFMKRLFIEVVIIGGLIWFAWNKPFGVWAGQTYTSISDAFDRLGGSLQKNQDQSVKRY